ncbi:MAG: inosine/xanthosine triphosphatase [Candidatus Aureabacteria bacterium]|nr:inosine/xanthosine triphosphatase [Candidatus Auribacterota bacterium]
MIINVGSLNRVKRGAVEEVCRELFGDVTIRHYGVDSGVAHTPSTDEEILRGAARRAEGAFRASRADLGIGLEGGIAPGPYGPLLKGWVAVFDGTDTFVGSTPGMPFPRHLLERVSAERELASVMDEVSGKEDVRSKEGAFGILTRNRITRLQSFKLALYCALAPIANREMYREINPKSQIPNPKI